MDNDEVDLRPYIAALVNKKWWIIAIGILFGVAALGFLLLSPRKYTANATLLLTRSRTMLSLAEQFPTVNEPVDSRSRMDALMTIAKGDAIANLTLQSLGDTIPDQYRSIEDIKSIINVKNNGDSISVGVTTENPELSASIANTWANHLSETISIAYSGEQPLNKIQERLKTAGEEYQKAQANLEQFIRENPQKDLETRLNEADNLLSAYGNERADQLAYLIKRKQELESLNQQLTALKRQLDDGNRSTAANIGDALAVILARMNSIAVMPINVTETNMDGTQTPRSSVVSQPNPVINLQLNGEMGDGSTAGSPADIAALVQLTEAEIANAEENIQKLASESAHPDPARLDTIAQNAAQIQALMQQIESAKAKELELTSNRDLTWKAYQALAQKETEIKNATSINNQVTIASEAIVPVRPDSRGTIQKTVVAGFAGIILGMIAVLGLIWWRNLNLSGTNAPETKESAKIAT